ncbi:MAG: hypothetical protein V3W44_09950 [Dehalococcoidales bacterium]
MLTLKFDRDKRYQLLNESGEDLFAKLGEYEIYIESMNIFMDHGEPQIHMKILGHGISVTVSEEEMKEAMIKIIRKGSDHGHTDADTDFPVCAGE